MDNDVTADIGRFGKLLGDIYAARHSVLAKARLAAYEHAMRKGNPYRKYGTWKNIFVEENGKVVAHAIVSFDSRQQGIANVGFVELIDDKGIAKLIDSIAQVAKEGNANTIRGPINFNTWQDFRFVSSGTDAPPFFLEPYTQKTELWRSEKFVSKVSYVSLADSVSHAPFGKKGASDVVIERVRPQTAASCAEGLHATALDAFANTWSFVPITLEEFSYIYEQPLAMSDTFLILVARDKMGKIIGFFVGAPDLYDPNGKTFVMKSMAVRPEWQSKGVGTALFSAVHEFATSQGFEKYIYSTIQENNETIHRHVGTSECVRTYEVGELSL